MPEVFRRVILLPDGLSDASRAELEERLKAAILWQNELAAKSPHVLQFHGTLQHDGSVLFVEHEPAKPSMDFGDLFNGAPPELDVKLLLRRSLSVFDALRAAHASEQKQRGHGGVCPGVILTTDDGIDKLTDFGFAPAICSSLGTDNYLNLAVGAKSGAVPDLQGTGFWEVLDPDDMERDDRLCCFIDPDSYRSADYGSFEPGSDIIAAGFVLHLIAEHQHPYLTDEDAHRLVDTSEFMALSRYNGSRRKELRDSVDRGVLLWCELMPQVLAGLPKDRPSAAKLVAELGQHIKTVDPDQLAKRRIEEAGKLVADKAYADARTKLAPFADNQDVSSDVREQAATLLRLADAHLLLQKAIDDLKGDHWKNAEQSLKRVLALPAIPDEVAQRAKKAKALLDHNLSVDQEMDALISRDYPVSKEDPDGAAAALRADLDRIAGITADQSVLPSIRAKCDSLAQERSSQLEIAQTELERIETERKEQAELLELQKLEDQQKAEDWLKKLETARDSENWDSLGKHLAQRPAITHWPRDVEQQAQTIQKNLAKLLAEQAKQEAIDADRKAAQQWLTSAQDALRSGDLDQAEGVLEKKPRLEYWPNEILEETRALADQIRVARRKDADAHEAHEYLKLLKQHVQDSDWSVANEVHSKRPALEHWPDDVIQEESQLHAKIKEHLAAEEQQEAAISAWLGSIEEAHRAGRFSEAIGKLKAPPVKLKSMAKDIRRQVEDLHKKCVADFEEHTRQLIEQRSVAVRAAVEDLVNGVARTDFGNLLNVDRLKLTLSNEEFDSPAQFTSGSARLELSLDDQATSSDEDRFAAGFEFKRQDDELRILQIDALQTEIRRYLSDLLGQLQKIRMEEYRKELNSGVFGKAHLAVKLGKPCDRVNTVIQLLGPDTTQATSKCEMVWDAAALTWRHADGGAFWKRASEVAAETSLAHIEKAIFKNLGDLEPYKTALSVSLAPAKVSEGQELNKAIPLEGRLSMKREGDKEERILHAFTIACRKAGHAPEDFSHEDALQGLRQAVLDAQNNSLGGLRKQLQDRVTKARVRAKINSLPDQISSPIDELRLTLRQRKVEATVGAKWSVNKLAYVTTGDWDKELAEVLTPQPGGVTAGKVAAAVVVAALVVGGGYGVLRPNGDADTDPDPSISIPPTVVKDNGGAKTDTGGTVTVPATQDSRIADADMQRLVAEIQAVFPTDSVLTDSATQLISADMGDATRNPSINVSIPGLAASRHRIAIRVSQDQGGNWANDESQLDGLKTSLGNLESLINPQNVQEALNNLLLGNLGADVQQFVDMDQLAIGLPSTLVWKPDNENLRADSSEATLQLRAESQVLVPFMADISLSNNEFLFTAVNGEAQPWRAVYQLILAKVDDLQSKGFDEMRTHLSDLCDSARLVNCNIPVLQLADRVTDLGLELGADNLIARKFPVSWDKASLKFTVTGDAWETGVASMRIAQNVLERINSAEERPAWLGDRLVQEKNAPDANGTWLLATSAPWVSEGDNSNGAALEIPVTGVQSAFRQNNANAVVKTVQEEAKPAYWGLVDGYEFCASGPALLTGGLRENLKKSLENTVSESPTGPQLLAYLSNDPQYVVPTIKLDPALAIVVNEGVDPAKASPGQPTSVTFDVKIGLRANDQLPQDANRLVINAALEELTGDGVRSRVKLTSSGDGSVTTEYQDAGALAGALEPNIDKVKSLDEMLGTFESRYDVEELLKVELGGSPVSDLGSRFNLVIQEVWKAKGTTPPQGINESEDIVRLLRFKETGTQRTKLFQKTKGARTRIQANLFAEYFCGWESCYAIVWSAGYAKNASAQPAIVDRAVLLRLCSTQDLLGGAETGELGDLGEMLVGAVIDAADKAKSGGTSLEKSERNVGIVMAPDHPMQFLDIAAMTFAAKHLYVGKINQNKGAQTDLTYDSLSDLRDKRNVKCDYRLIRTLASPDSDWQRVAVSNESRSAIWATQRLTAAP